MIKKIVLGLALSLSYLSALSLADVEKEEAKVHALSKKVDRYYVKILSDGVGDIDNIFQYNDDNSKVIKDWFYIISQKNKNSNIGYFVSKSKYIIDGYLQELNVQNKIKSEDYKIIRAKLKNIANSEHIKYLNETYTLLQNVNFRNLPIFSPVTKKTNNGKAIVLKKGEKVNLLYKIYYKNRYEHIATWAYVSLKNDDKGWVNLKYCKRGQE